MEEEKVKLSKKQELVQPTGRFDYFVDKFDMVYLIDNESKFVKPVLGLTKKKLSRNKIAHLFSDVLDVVGYFKSKGNDIIDLDMKTLAEGELWISFKFKEHVFSAEKVVCSMCYKFTTSKDNVVEKVKHGKSHYFNTYGMSEAELTKFFVSAIPSSALEVVAA